VPMKMTEIFFDVDADQRISSGISADTGQIAQSW
jgi:hypothetical protein